jgi:hypothetical protein
VFLVAVAVVMVAAVAAVAAVVMVVVREGRARAVVVRASEAVAVAEVEAAVPLAVATGVAMGAAAAAQITVRRLTMLVCLCWSFVAAWALVHDAGGRLALSGRIDVASGALDLEMLASENDAIVESVRGRPGVEATASGLFKGQRILSVGWSTPFWLPPDARVWWSTVWDRSLMEDALAQPDPLAWLRERFDLILLDEPMLRRWQRSGWLSPELDPGHLRSVLAGQDEMQLAGGRTLIGLGERLQPTWPKRHHRDAAERSY